MRAILRSLAAACLLALLPAASRADFSLGTNLGMTFHRLSGASSSTTLIEWPNSAGDYEPGLRVGFRPSDPHHELYVNSGLISQSHEGSNYHIIEATLNYQYNFLPDDPSTAYLTIGSGLLSVGGSSSSSDTSGLFGGGLGVRFRVSEGHGSLRAEARYDRLGESHDHELHKASLFGIRLGFDLWLQ